MAKNRDRIIQEAQNDIINKKLPLEQFLRQFTRSLREYDYPNVQLYKGNTVIYAIKNIDIYWATKLYNFYKLLFIGNTEKDGHNLRELKVVLQKINVKL